MSEGATTHEERFEFQAEIRELLHLIIYSLYTKREIFLRELISNASDALDKMRFLHLTEPDLPGKDLPLEIKIELDEKHKILSISDTGVGMTRAELVSNLGTIARSGSKEFLKKLAEAGSKDVNLIGQFGVGFYSAFMAASEVRVITRSYKADEPGQIWVSTGAGAYTIREFPVDTRGTRIEISLKDDATELATAFRIEDIIRKYSSFVPYPIYVGGKEVREAAALWTKPKSEVSTEEYESFYKFLTNDFEGPASTLHLTSDAPLSFRAVLFLPKTNLEKLGMGKLEHGPDLYARRVLIQHNCKDLVPDHLRFVRGVVDSEDIALNVSRETIQDDVVLRRIRKHISKKIMDEMADMLTSRREEYKKFHAEFGRILREGIATGAEESERLAKLLLFDSSAPDEAGKEISLKEYKERMPEGQKAIYYLTGPDRESLDAGPHLEMFRGRKVEVLYLYDPVDDFVLDRLGKFDDVPLVSADRAEPADLKEIATPEGEKPAEEKKEETLAYKSAFDAFIKRFKEALGDRVLDVKESERLAESPCILVNPGKGPSIQVQRVMQMINKDMPIARQALEVNREHPLIRSLVEKHKDDPGSSLVTECMEQLFENALLAEGILPDPSKLVKRVHRIMSEAVGSRH